MTVRWFLAGSLVVAGVAGCAGADPQRSAGSPAPGTATIGIGTDVQHTINDVSCLALSDSYSRISIGSATQGVQTYLDSAGELEAKSVAFTDFGGFTGSFWQGLQGQATITADETAYIINGWARGFVSDDPSAVTDKSFHIEVYC